MKRGKKQIVLLHSHFVSIPTSTRSAFIYYDSSCPTIPIDSIDAAASIGQELIPNVIQNQYFW